MEMKGNIRVFCRVRPSLQDVSPTVSYPGSVLSSGRNIDLQRSDKKFSFAFDRVFDSKASQEDVFSEISQLVQSALDGYKVCIFAYGQTGSGKTHTMMGGKDEERGLIPRSLEKVFQTRDALAVQGWNCEIKVSMQEIYNNRIRDLLPSDSERCCNTADEVRCLLKKAKKNRVVAETKINQQSSRSHFILCLEINGENDTKEVKGVLCLIDLAGTDRVEKSGVIGKQLKEATAINKSLSELGDVISALSKKEKHVPYRDCKLTYHLKPYLEGDSKILMFVNITGDPVSFEESLCSLQFVSKANICTIKSTHRRTDRS